MKTYFVKHWKSLKQLKLPLSIMMIARNNSIILIFGTVMYFFGNGLIDFLVLFNFVLLNTK